LLFPLRAWPLVFGLALALSVLTGSGLLVLPQIIDELDQRRFYIILPFLALGPLFALGYLCAFLQCVLSSGVTGEAGRVRWPAGDGLLIVKSSLLWIFCFLAGPVVPAVVAFLFWFEGADPEIVDWLIIGELSFAAVAHWLFSLLAVSRRDRLRDLNPAGVAEVAHRLGVRGAFAVLLATTLALAHAAAIVFSLEFLQRQAGRGGLLLFAAWLSALFWATFFFRWLGLWCFYRKIGEDIRSGKAFTEPDSGGLVL
jgi:hypothetical protein